MKSFFLLLFLLPSLTLANASGNGGDLVGNGGDGHVIAFRNTGLDLATQLNSLNSSCQSQLPFSVQQLVKAVYQAKIESSQDELSLGGRRVEAINYPLEGRIIFHFPSFDANNNRPQFVLHEFLGLLKIADTKGDELYGWSKYILSLGQNPDCARAVSLRQWTKKQRNGNLVHFAFSYPAEVLTYDLTQEKETAPRALPDIARGFQAVGENIYFGTRQFVCALVDPLLCAPDTQAPSLLQDFAIDGSRIVESLRALAPTKDALKIDYAYPDLQIANVDKKYHYTVDVTDLYKDNAKWLAGDYHTSVRGVLSLGHDRMIAVADQYRGDTQENFSLLRIDLLGPGVDGANTDTVQVREPKDYNDQIYHASRRVVNAYETLNIEQELYYLHSNPLTRALYPVRGGKFLVADSGTVYDVETLRPVALLASGIEDAIEYGEFTLTLVNSRILVYDRDWHEQGEILPSVRPQGIERRGDTLFLFSMLSDQKLFVEKRDMGEFTQKRATCLIEDAALAAFTPGKTYSVSGRIVALAPAQGCVLWQRNGKWERWMGVKKNPLAVLDFSEQGKLALVYGDGLVTSADIDAKENAILAQIVGEIKKAERKDDSLVLIQHDPGQMGDFLHWMELSLEGQLKREFFFWNVTPEFP